MDALKPDMSSLVDLRAREGGSARIGGNMAPPNCFGSAGSDVGALRVNGPWKTYDHSSEDL